MACQQCQNAGTPCHYFNIPSCTLIPTEKGRKLAAACIFYTGAKLTCTDIEPNTSLEEILQVMDSKICNDNDADFSLYELACLDEDIVITTEQDWVEKVSADLCELKDTVANLPETNEDVETLQAQVESIIQPNLTLPPITNTTPSDSLNELIVGIANAVNTVNNEQSISTVNWDTVYTSTSEPDTLTEGFNEVLAQMLLLKNASTAALTLPTFNTNSACIATHGASTPLTQVINDLLLKTCEAPVWTPSLISMGCIAPLDDSTTLTSVVGGMANSINTFYSERKIFNPEHFITEASDGCSESLVSLREDLITTNKVAIDEADTAGYLEDKLEAGSNLQFDTSTEPGKIIINANFTNPGTLKVASGGSLGYLENKVIGSSDNGITISVSNVSDQLKINVSLNLNTLASALLTAIADDSDLKTQLCAINAECE